MDRKWSKATRVRWSELTFQSAGYNLIAVSLEVPIKIPLYQNGCSTQIYSSPATETVHLIQKRPHEDALFLVRIWGKVRYKKSC